MDDRSIIVSMIETLSDRSTTLDRDREVTQSHSSFLVCFIGLPVPNTVALSSQIN